MRSPHLSPLGGSVKFICWPLCVIWVDHYELKFTFGIYCLKYTVSCILQQRLNMEGIIFMNKYNNILNTRIMRQNGVLCRFFHTEAAIVRVRGESKTQ
jgi:hypothetical protein